MTYSSLVSFANLVWGSEVVVRALSCVTFVRGSEVADLELLVPVSLGWLEVGMGGGADGGTSDLGTSDFESRELSRRGRLFRLSSNALYAALI